MKPLTAAQIAESTGGTLVAGEANAVAASVSTSSKDAAAGCVFVALRGDKHDGHAYLGDIGGRATVALVDRDVAAVPGVAMVKVPEQTPAEGDKPFTKPTWMESMTIPVAKQRIRTPIWIGDRGKHSQPYILVSPHSTWSGADSGRVDLSFGFVVARH